MRRERERRFDRRSSTQRNLTSLNKKISSLTCSLRLGGIRSASKQLLDASGLTSDLSHRRGLLCSYIWRRVLAIFSRLWPISVFFHLLFYGFLSSPLAVKPSGCRWRCRVLRQHRIISSLPSSKMFPSDIMSKSTSLSDYLRCVLLHSHDEFWFG